MEGADIGNAALTEANSGQMEKSVETNQLTLLFQDPSLVGNERAEVMITKRESWRDARFEVGIAE